MAAWNGRIATTARVTGCGGTARPSRASGAADPGRADGGAWVDPAVAAVPARPSAVVGSPPTASPTAHAETAAAGTGTGGATGNSVRSAAAVVPVATTAARLARDGVEAGTDVLEVRTACPKRGRPAVTSHPPSRLDDGLQGRRADYEPISTIYK